MIYTKNGYYEGNLLLTISSIVVKELDLEMQPLSRKILESVWDKEQCYSDHLRN
jgi:hypothetical protein